MKELVITAVGPDRPGLVNDLTGCLERHGVNVADSRMINLHGRFAILMLAEARRETVEEVKAAVKRTASGLSLELAFNEPEEAPGPKAGKPYILKTYAMDQPGIVHRITAMLERFGVNVEELQSTLDAGPHSGAPLFSLSIKMTVPAEASIKQLREELQQLCESLNCDVELRPATG